MDEFPLVLSMSDFQQHVEPRSKERARQRIQEMMRIKAQLEQHDIQSVQALREGVEKAMKISQQQGDDHLNVADEYQRLSDEQQRIWDDYEARKQEFI